MEKKTEMMQAECPTLFKGRKRKKEKEKENSQRRKTRFPSGFLDFSNGCVLWFEKRRKKKGKEYEDSLSIKGTVPLF